METVWGCVHCPDFTVIDRGATLDEPAISPDGWHFTMTRHLWELEMVRHWRERHPEELASLGRALATTITDEWVIQEMHRSSQAALDLITTQLGSDPHRR